MSYSSRQAYATHTAAALVIGAALTATTVPAAKEAGKEPLFRRTSYFASENGATYGTYTDILTGSWAGSPDSMQVAISGLYATLVANQEPLGADFEKVLFDNLWSLYEEG
jgi:hypothetical protein